MPRSAAQNRDARERSQAAILHAAFEVFGDKGYHEASLAEIARHAGVAQGLVSYYFGGKEQLVGAVLDAYFAKMTALAFDDESADERLRTIIDMSLIGADQSMPQQRITLGLSILPTTHRIYAESEQRSLEAVLAAGELMQDLFRERGADDPALEEVMLRSVLEGVIVKRAVYGRTYPLQAARCWVHRMYGLGDPAEPLPFVASDPASTALRAIDA
ncbi:TetR/AcrR family transcriptional regulator [Microbacterium sp. KUDC0406]|uniref:TetR/AcrR family transcriptional regulator n=1 Tax=Microbacterium sp. KUDC0406 TaxID=2909588 RepID=UPI001F2AB3F3|nr:TetR/AcrR family transcriptional regulator [Microbacterium sp. KUDC0406]UJP09253.1 TetR/AcrR family transcriptional regulator [Microbacterium sp. KUDC0406]